MAEFTLTAICALCDESFEARTTYGICPDCYDRDKLREFDRWQKGKMHAERAHVPVTLTFTDWLSVVTDFHGHCGYCLTEPLRYIEMVDPLAGFTKQNVVGICRVCQIHKQRSFTAAEQRVRAYLDYDPSQPVPLPERSIIALGEIFPGFDSWYRNRQQEVREEEEDARNPGGGDDDTWH
jgi:hypothetical protein